LNGLDALHFFSYKRLFSSFDEIAGVSDEE
jgi:hypothetical protein